MKVSAFIAAALLVVSVSAQADHHEEKKAAAKPAAAAAAPAKADDHKDCSKMKGKAKTECEAHEKAAHAAGETHAH